MKKVNQFKELSSDVLLYTNGGDNWISESLGFIQGTIESAAIGLWRLNLKAAQMVADNNGHCSVMPFK